MPRNLPDPLAREAIRRGGVIGVNFIGKFVDPDAADGHQAILRQIEHGLELGGEDALCLGADYFATFDVPDDMKTTDAPVFYPGLGTSAGYPALIEAMRRRFGDEIARKITSGNAIRFASRSLAAAG